jgi:hypothetical protein
MLRNHGFRWVAALAVVLLLAGPAASVHAAGFGRPVTGGIGIWNDVGGLWSWIKAAVLGGAAQTACDKGSYIDPNGGCRAATLQTACDKGISIDPDGGCRAAAAAASPGATADSDKGGYIDPNGG